MLKTSANRGDEMADIQDKRSKELQTRGGEVSRRGQRLPSLFSMTPRDFFSANPFELMRRFTDEMDRVFSGFGAEEARLWAPAIEIQQKDNNLVVTAELPGLKKEDIKIEVTDDGLVIEGERKREQERREEGFYHSERSYGHFRRLIPLPQDANIEQANASFNDGILEVRIPVPQQERRRREIPIETGGKTRTAGGGD